MKYLLIVEVILSVKVYNGGSFMRDSKQFITILLTTAVYLLFMVSCPFLDTEEIPPSEYIRPLDPDENAPNPDIFGITIDPNATINTRKLYTWMQQLSSRTTDKIISGQHIGDKFPERDFDVTVLALFEETGKWPAMIGLDYFRGVSFDGEKITDSEKKTDIIIDYWAQGGLITVNIHLINPWTGGNSNDKSFNGGMYSDAYTPGTLAYKNLKEDFDHLADHLLKIQDEGVSILYRPFHEVNGDWFWWHHSDPEQFIQLWRYWKDYLMEERGVHNLLYVFSPNAGIWDRPPHMYYPGDEYVDIISLDAYKDNLMDLSVRDYTDFIRLKKGIGKPFGFMELGRNFNNHMHSETWDQLNMIEALKYKFTNAVFWQSGGSWECSGIPVNMAIVDLPHAYELMVEEPLVLTRDELTDLTVFREAALAYSTYYCQKISPVDTDLEPLIPSSNVKSQRWAYSFRRPPADWVNTSFDDSTWKKGMAPFGSPWIKPLPVLPRYQFKFDDIKKQLYLRKKFEFTETLPKQLIIRTFILGGKVEFYLNGIKIADLERNHETYAYTDIVLKANALDALQKGTNVLAIQCIGNLSWGDFFIDVGLYTSE